LTRAHMLPDALPRTDRAGNSQLPMQISPSARFTMILALGL
jgi:hypothetical protein